MPLFAAGINAKGYCDRCGRKVRLNDLRNQTMNRSPTGLKVCDDCLDIDHEQLQVGLYFRPETMAVKDPRPELHGIGRGFYGWMPIYGVAANPAVGTLTPTVT